MVVLVDYGMGNLHSVGKALESAGGDVRISSEAKDVELADRIVLPGVGSFGQGMEHLNELGLTEVLYEQVMIKKKPFLGICLGMQLVAKTGEEYGDRDGLGWIDARVVVLDCDRKEFKVPHMGWNDVEFSEDNHLFKGLKSPASFYFVHSYHFVPDDAENVTGYFDHGGRFVASFKQDNISLLQFHPEKSQDNGLCILENFLKS